MDCNQAKQLFDAFLDGELSVPLATESSASRLESQDAVRLKDMIWSSVDQLTPPQRASVLLFYRYEVNCQEIARVLELPVATVKSHLHRARNRLREMLEQVTEKDLRHLRNRTAVAG